MFVFVLPLRIYLSFSVNWSFIPPFFVVCFHSGKISYSLLRSCTVAWCPVTLSEAITVATHGYRFPLILRHNLSNWCQSWGPNGKSPENTHIDRHAHLLTLKKKKKWGLVNVALQLVISGGGVKPSSHSSLTESFSLSQSRLTLPTYYSSLTLYTCSVPIMQLKLGVSQPFDVACIQWQCA